MVLLCPRGESLMKEKECKYKKLKQWRDHHVGNYLTSNEDLNRFHHELMKNVIEIAMKEVKKAFGDPPSDFSWFVMGSGGRFEQAIVSDQDHGLVYERKDEQSDRYFKALGEEITKGLYTAGYPYCDGNVMCSNPTWCRSIKDWQAQIIDWMKEASWESIRYLLIFYDARTLIGNSEIVQGLKQLIYNFIGENPKFLIRLLNNTMRIQKGVGFFGQLLTETHGDHSGSIHIKNYGFFPYVNGVRLLAIKEQINVTSTLARFDQLSQLSGYKQKMNNHQLNFKKLLDFRLRNVSKGDNYEDIHYLNIKGMNRKEKAELKQILKDVIVFHQYIQNMILKGN
jgi:CBS domain-containing protein